MDEVVFTLMFGVTKLLIYIFLNIEEGIVSGGIYESLEESGSKMVMRTLQEIEPAHSLEIGAPIAEETVYDPFGAAYWE